MHGILNLPNVNSDKNMTKNNEQNLVDVNEVVNSIRKYLSTRY